MLTPEQEAFNKLNENQSLPSNEVNPLITGIHPIMDLMFFIDFWSEDDGIEPQLKGLSDNNSIKLLNINK